MNQFERLELLVGDKIKNIEKAKVLVIGLGGVGSYAVEGLIRSGISNITIVDSDKIQRLLHLMGILYNFWSSS